MYCYERLCYTGSDLVVCISVYIYIFINVLLSFPVEGRPKSVVVFLNPLGGSANSLSFFRKDVEPIFKMAEIKSELIGK